MIVRVLLEIPQIRDSSLTERIVDSVFPLINLKRKIARYREKLYERRDGISARHEKSKSQ